MRSEHGLDSGEPARQPERSAELAEAGGDRDDRDERQPGPPRRPAADAEPESRQGEHQGQAPEIERRGPDQALARGGKGMDPRSVLGPEPPKRIRPDRLERPVRLDAEPVDPAGPVVGGAGGVACVFQDRQELHRCQHHRQGAGTRQRGRSGHRLERALSPPPPADPEAQQPPGQDAEDRARHRDVRSGVGKAERDPDPTQDRGPAPPPAPPELRPVLRGEHQRVAAAAEDREIRRFGIAPSV